MRSPIRKLGTHLRENGWRKTARDVPVLLHRRLGGSVPSADLPAVRQAPGRIADEPRSLQSQSVSEVTRQYRWVKEPESLLRQSRDVESERPADAPLVSVIIPCYGQAHFLDDAIGSILDQTYPYFEIIVVDDGSPDNTFEVASSYPAVRCIRQENKGLAGARNGGLPHARGDYVLFLDADDRLMSNALETNLEYFDAHPECAFVCGQQRVIAADGTLLKILQRPLIGYDLYATLLGRSHFVIPGSVMYRRSVFDEVSPFDPAVNGAADYDLYFRIARRYPVYWHDKVVLEYRRHGSNMTTNKAAQMLKDTVAVLRAQRPYIKENERYLEAYEAGMLKGQETYGIPLAESVRAHLENAEWGQATRNMLVLSRYYPRGLTLLSESRLERQKLLRRLRGRQKQLLDSERELQARSRQLEELKVAVEEGRKATLQLRKSTQHLARQVEQNSNPLGTLFGGIGSLVGSNPRKTESFRDSK